MLIYYGKGFAKNFNTCHRLSKRRQTVIDWNSLVSPDPVMLCCGFLFVGFFFPQMLQMFCNWIIRLINFSKEMCKRKVFKQNADSSNCAGDKLPWHRPLRHLHYFIHLAGPSPGVLGMKSLASGGLLGT